MSRRKQGEERQRRFDREVWWSEERPFFARVPNCAWCNWDWHTDTEEEWIYAAYLPGPPDQERPDKHWVWNRNYVGWLCHECAQNRELVCWFADEVKQRYPEAVFVKHPGKAHERLVSLCSEELYCPVEHDDSGRGTFPDAPH